jgi:iron complex transport system ATP-binding protein
MVQLQNVSYTIDGKTIFNDVSATLIPHQITTLIGPNGIGKSTLLKLVTQSIKPDTGRITNIPDNLALLAQTNELFEPLTVRELLTIKREALDDEILALLQLTDLLDDHVHHLSGGQRQLVWLGYVLHQAPTLLLLDEPTTYLDLHYQQLFLNALTRLQKKRGFTVLMVLHDLTQTFHYSQNVWLLNDDKKLITGPAVDLLDEGTLSNAFKLPLSIVAHDGKQLIIPK